MNLEKIIESLDPVEQAAFLEAAEDYIGSLNRELAQVDFIKFAHEMWPGFIDGRHHKIMAQKFQEIAEGKCKRLIVNMPPRHTKSEFASYLLPAWFLGKYPGKKIIQTSNTAELAVGFGRKVRNLVGSEQYAKIFPGVTLKSDSKAAGRWGTNHDGSYFAIGVGGTVTGKGADLLIIDDPHSEQEAAIAATNPEVYDKVYEWYSSGPRQRLQPGGAIVIIMCMTGDTLVLMADGTEKPLKEIRVGDTVATYIDGKIATSKIANWRSSGVDSIYKVQTQYGKILRANKRHPFLVDWNGVRKWARLEDLVVGMDLVSTKDATDHQSQKQIQDCASRATQSTCTTRKTLMRRIIQSVITENGKMQNVLAGHRFMQKVCAWFATESNTIRRQELQRKQERLASNTATELRLSNTIKWCWNAIINVMCVAKSQIKKILVLIGMENCASTTVTIQAKSEACSVMTVTSPLGTEKHQILSFGRLNTYDVILDRIVSIEYDGKEEVFDVEVDHTENFIANGIVVHNTRWSKRDLVGKIIKSSIERDGEEWDVVEFPAILPSGNSLWPEFWPIGELLALKNELPVSKWNAQYMQSPTSEEGAMVKREWWKIWEKDMPPKCEFVIQSWDTAFTKNERSDYSACTTWGVFYMNENVNDPHIILLDAVKERLEFPELKAKALEMYNEWEPDACVIEAKAAGSPLIYELRKMGILVSEFTPTRGNDKIARMNSVTDLFSSGRVWAPSRRWAEEVIEEMAAFPNSEHDDLVDSSTQALIRFRKGGFVSLPSDEPDEPITFRRKAAYY